ncbi:MAG: hypothetical protein GWP14_03090 [Actinobacteria bacterium]|nr:hypothetical protein [Actinomycetota bacterium]
MAVLLAKRLGALRAFSFPVSVLPVLIATALVRPLNQWDWGVLMASVLGVVLLHAAGNLFNDYFDFRSGVDRKLDGDGSRPGRFLVRDELKPKEVLVEALICLLLALPVGIYLMVRCGPSLLWFAGAAGFGLYCYTGPPLKLKYRALGELLIFLVFGPLLMLGAGFAQAGSMQWNVLLLSVPVGLATTAILAANNIRDQQEDQVAGIVTLAQLVGVRALRWLYILLVVGCVFGLAGLAVVKVGPRVLVCAPLGLMLLIKPITHVWQSKRLADIDVRTARFESVLLMFVLVSLLFQQTPS